MKKISLLFLIAFSLFFTGCFDTTQETTIKVDGSGLFTNTIDLSNMMSLLKQMGGGDSQKLQNTDTTISLAGFADSIQGFTSEQKKVIYNGTMHITLNLQDEKLLIKLSLPFQKISDISMLQQVLPKVTETAMKKLPGSDQMPPGMAEQDTSKIKNIDDFYSVNFTDHLITKTLDKEKYAAGKDGEFLKSMQQMSEMGAPMTANYIINLPRPATKVEGKAIKLSDDKKTVTVNLTSDDFSTDPSKFEYRIEY